jgi:hypothetical protein
MLVDAPNVAATQGDAMAVEEFQDLDCDLAPVVDAIAKLTRAELAVSGLCADVDHDLDHFRDSAAQEKMVVRDLVDFSHPAQQLQQPSHVTFASAEHTGHIANPRRTKTVLSPKQRGHFSPEPFIRISQPDRMFRQSHPGAVEGYFL